MEKHIRIKFLDAPDERERVKQIVDSIIERFDSESLGFSASNELFYNVTTIQDFENWCTIYDIDELSKLENVKSMKDFLSQYPGIESYPNVCSLLRVLINELRN